MKQIKLFKPYISRKARKYVAKVLKGSQIAEGPMVKKFEEAFAKSVRLNAADCVAVNSGTAALELAYEMAGIVAGDEVITPVLTCTATNLPLLHRGATIVFADIDRYLLLDPDDVKKRITEKTKAIVFVDFGGATRTNLKAIMQIAEEHKLKVIQDSAQSYGPFFRPMGDFVCMSFQAIKTLTTGDGGMLICKDAMVARQARMLRWFGIDREAKQRLGDVDVYFPGYKYHMNDIAAAIGLGNIESIAKPIRQRNRLAWAYQSSLLPILPYPWLAILIHDKALEIGAFLKENGIDTGQHHYRNDKYTVFGGKRSDLPMMDSMEDKYLLLPFHHDVTAGDVVKICILIQTFLKSQWKNG